MTFALLRDSKVGFIWRMLKQKLVLTRLKTHFEPKVGFKLKPYLKKTSDP